MTIGPIYGRFVYSPGFKICRERTLENLYHQYALRGERKERMASEKLVYDYGPTTTIGTLLKQYFAHEQTNAAMVADLLKVTEQLVERWLSDELTNGLLTKLRRPFEELTGIDIDRLRVIEAKRELVEDPAVGVEIPFDRWHTREEILNAIRPYVEATNCELIAEQLRDMSGSSISQWLRPGSDRLPEREGIKSLVLGLCHGFISGNRNDVLFVMVRRTVLKSLKLTIDPRPDITSFAELIKAINDDKRGQTDTQFASVSGIETHQLRNIAYTPVEEIRPTRETLELFVRYLYGTKPEYRTDVTTEPEIVASEESSTLVASPSNGVSEKHKTLPKNVPVNDWRAKLTGSLEQAAQSLLAGVEALKNAPQASVEVLAPPGVPADFSATMQGDIPVGEDLKGIRFCLTEASFKPRPGRQWSRAEVEDTLKLLEELRRRFTAMAELDSPFRREYHDRLAHEIDELFLAARTSRIAGAAALELLGKERETFDGMRAALRLPPVPTHTKKG